MATTRRKLSNNVINTLSIVDDSQGRRDFRPVPKPRISKGAPLVIKRVDLGSTKGSFTSSKVNFSDASEIGKLLDKNSFSTKSSHGSSGKRVDTVTSKSYSDDSFNKSLKYLRKSNAGLENKKKSPITRHVNYQNSKKSIKQSDDFDQFAQSGLEIQSKGDIKEVSKVKKSPVKNIQLKGGIQQVSEEFASFSEQQGFELSESLLTDSSFKSRDRAPSRQVTFDKDGKKQVTLSNDFEEYTVSTLQSLSDKTLEPVASSTNSKPRTKLVQIKDGKRDVSYSQDFEDFSSTSLVNLKNLSDLDDTKSNKTRPVTSHVSFVDGLKNVTYSSDFDTFAHSLDLQKSKNFYSETDLDTLTKSQDLGNASWLESKGRKKHVNVSDEFENFSLGPTIEFTNKPKAATRKDVFKKVEYKDGRRHVSYSDEFLHSLNYSDDFENSASSWAVKIRGSSAQSPVTKHVEYKDGKKHVTYSTDLENTYLEQETCDLDTSSFREIALEDLEDHSYTEDFDSITAKGHSTAKSITSAASVPSGDAADDTEVWSSSTHTPITSIHTNIQHSGESRAQNQTRDIGLYSESYETISLLKSETADYSVTEDSSVLLSPRSPRSRLRNDTLTRTMSLFESESEDDSYTMTYSQPTVESVEETPEEKRNARLAKEAFIKTKMRVVKKSNNEKRYVPPPMEDKLSGNEAKQFNKFIRGKMKAVQNKGDSFIPCSSTQSARCLLKGIDASASVEDYGISSSVIAHLKMENTMHHIKEAAKQDVHDPQSCDECREKMALHAAREFMWHKKAIVSEKLVQEKTEMQILQLQDPVWLYAEALRGLPKLTDHREEIYDKLMRPLYDSYAVNASNYVDTMQTT